MNEHLGWLHNLSVRFGLTTIDQSISSISNFAVGVGVARVAGVTGFGAYSLVYAAWLILAAMHRSLVTDPMAIYNDVRGVDASAHVRAGLAAELSLGLGAGTLFAGIGMVLLVLGQHEFGVCFLGIAPWVPCLLAQDYWRWVSFMKALPQRAIVNDVIFDTVQLVAFATLYVVGVHSAVVAVMAWGIGAGVGAVFGLWQFWTAPSLRGGFGKIKLRWALSKWLVAESVASQATGQATAVLTGAVLGPAGIGGLKAATSLVGGPAMVLIQAGGNIGLPEASRALKERGWPGLRRVERAITAAGMASVGLVAVVVLVFGHPLIDLLYGRAFGRFATIADILAIGYLIATFGLGPILSLKVTRQTQRLVPVSVISLVVSVVSVVLLAPRYGVVGAAISTVIGLMASSVGLLVTHLHCSRRAADRLGGMAADQQGADQQGAEQLGAGDVADGLAAPGPVHPSTVDGHAGDVDGERIALAAADAGASAVGRSAPA